MAKWALVTGASKRIGRVIALELAAHGWDIVIHYRSSETEAKKLAEEIQKLGQQACLAEIDLTNAKMTEKLIPSLVQELGPINVLVNNAALFEPDVADPDGSRHWAVNAEAPRLLSKAFAASLPKGDRGAIVNLLDATPMPEKFSGYARSKKFLADITINMAKSFAPRIRVNGVAPMYVLPGPRQSEEAFRKMAGTNLVSPQQVAHAVRRLIETPSATGEIVIVDKTAPRG
ncbi:MAG: SDR family NAD(P)-dependent oxidoreductase [Alphaproteobacteria bacterium]|nr:SDR family NAD(P)-dependent oxidoreductase [Alphaproteobacteria bacterium]